MRDTFKYLSRGMGDGESPNFSSSFASLSNSGKHECFLHIQRLTEGDNDESAVCVSVCGESRGCTDCPGDQRRQSS